MTWHNSVVFNLGNRKFTISVIAYTCPTVCHFWNFGTKEGIFILLHLLQIGIPLFLKDTNKMDTLVYTFHFRLQDQTKKHLFMLCYTFRQLYFCFHLNFLLLKFFVPNSIKNVLSQWHFQVKHFPSLLFLTNKFHEGRIT